jgi:hypothetical protein
MASTLKRHAVGLIAVASFALAAVVLPATQASAATPGATQQSQITFVMTYLHYKGGGKIDHDEAWSLVQQYPDIPTMAEAGHLGFGSTHVMSVALRPKADAASSGCKSGGWSYWVGPSSAEEFGWNETLQWCYNAGLDTVGFWSTGTPPEYQYGGPWVASWAAWVWHYSGEVLGTGYPRGFKALDSCGDVWYVEYDWIPTFTAGWGPATDTVYLDLFIRGYSTGSGLGGDF